MKVSIALTPITLWRDTKLAADSARLLTEIDEGFVVASIDVIKSFEILYGVLSRRLNVVS